MEQSTLHSGEPGTSVKAEGTLALSEIMAVAEMNGTGKRGLWMEAGRILREEAASQILHMFLYKLISSL